MFTFKVVAEVPKIAKEAHAPWVEMNKEAWSIRRSYPEKTLEIALQTKQALEDIGYMPELAYSYRNIGTAYYLLSLYEESLTNLEKARELFEETGNRHALATTIRTEGNVFHSIDQDEKALDQYREALTIVQELGDVQGMAYNLGNIGYVYRKLGRMPEAEEAMRETLELLEPLKDYIGLSDVKNNMAVCCLDQNDTKRARMYLESALVEAREVDHLRGLASANLSMSRLAMMEDDLEEALARVVLAEQYGKKMGEKLLIGEILRQKSSLQEELGNPASALKTYREFQQIDHELLLSQKKSTLEAIRMEAEITRMNREQEIIHKRNKELARANRIIEKRTKDLIDSLHYARNIQEASLCNEEQFKEVFPDGFVFFRPRDIVSGDFYFVHKVREFHFLIVADCTGHGVPGAFMSLMGNDYLHQIITDKNIRDTAIAVTRLNERVISSLRKRTSAGIRDGMDLAMCVIDTKGNELMFTGAKRPALILREGKIITLPADRLSVGEIPLEGEVFTSNTVSIKAGDEIFLYSDGLTDQFGGGADKKWKVVRFRELLRQHSGESMEDKRRLIERAFLDWQGEEPQTDDVCLLGVRVG